MVTLAILLCAAVTFALRYFPLNFASQLKKNETLNGVAALLPAGLMLILVAYTFTESGSAMEALRLLIGLGVALITELATRNILLAFVMGIVTYSLTALVF